MNYFNKISKCSLLLLLALTFTQTIQAQDTPPFELGAGLIYGTEIEEIGFNVRANYSFNENLRIAPSINYFIPNKEDIGGFENKTSIWSINVDGNYLLFIGSDMVNLYGLAGLNVTLVKTSQEQEVEGGFNTEISEDTETEVGLNLGIGVDVDLGRITPFGEFKYVVSEFDQAVLTVGVKVRIGQD
ncbi:MAG: porin family protein [Bacteroidia bacterium]|nr:porin family protein [Bacteroidia bacterium]